MFVYANGRLINVKAYDVISIMYYGDSVTPDNYASSKTKTASIVAKRVINEHTDYEKILSVPIEELDALKVKFQKLVDYMQNPGTCQVCCL